MCLPGLCDWSESALKGSKKQYSAHTKHNSRKKLVLLSEATVQTGISLPFPGNQKLPQYTHFRHSSNLRAKPQSFCPDITVMVHCVKSNYLPYVHLIYIKTLIRSCHFKCEETRKLMKFNGLARGSQYFELLYAYRVNLYNAESNISILPNLYTNKIMSYHLVHLKSTAFSHDQYSKPDRPEKLFQ